MGQRHVVFLTAPAAITISQNVVLNDGQIHVLAYNFNPNTEGVKYCADMSDEDGSVTELKREEGFAVNMAFSGWPEVSAP